MSTQQYIKLNTGAKEIQQVNCGGPDNSQSIKPQPSQFWIRSRGCEFKPSPVPYFSGD